MLLVSGYFSHNISLISVKPILTIFAFSFFTFPKKSFPVLQKIIILSFRGDVDEVATLPHGGLVPRAILQHVNLGFFIFVENHDAECRADYYRLVWPRVIRYDPLAPFGRKADGNPRQKVGRKRKRN